MRKLLIACVLASSFFMLPQTASAGGSGGVYWGFGYSSHGYPAYRGRGWRYGRWAAPRGGVYFGIPYAGYPPYSYGRSYYAPPRSRAYYNRRAYRRGHARRAYGRPAAWSPEWYRYCSAKYRSFNPRTGYYLAYSGRYRLCR